MNDHSHIIESQDLSNYSVLLVGVGGIGCEVLKCLSKFKLKQLVIIDMDDIELSNLNRQFYFRPQHIGHPKVMVAKEVFETIAPQLNIVAYQENIFNPEFDSTFFKQFQAVIMALDNQEARSHINRICINNNIPMLESGTFGFLGQAFLILPKVSRCYDCYPKASQTKGVQICTIRTNPTKPEHCMYWAKLVFNNLFDIQMTDETFRIVECVKSKEANVLELLEQFKDILIRHFCTQIDVVKNANLEKFGHLIPMDEAQIEADFKAVCAELLENLQPNEGSNNEVVDCSQKMPQTNSEELDKPQNPNSSPSTKAALRRFLLLVTIPESFGFDKDDELHVEFVTDLSNLRSYNFAIQPQTNQEVRSKIGLIIPALSSTNSLVAGLLVQEMLKYFYKVTMFNSIRLQHPQKISSAEELMSLLDEKQLLQMYFYQNFESYASNSDSVKIIKSSMQGPYEKCKVCLTKRMRVTLNYQTVLKDVKVWLTNNFGRLDFYVGGKSIFSSLYEEDQIPGENGAQEEYERADDLSQSSSTESLSEKPFKSLAPTPNAQEIESLLMFEDEFGNDQSAKLVFINDQTKELNTFDFCKEGTVSELDVLWRFIQNSRSLLCQETRFSRPKMPNAESVSFANLVELSDSQSKRSSLSIQSVHDTPRSNNRDSANF